MISHQHKCIFIHLRRTGGNSIEQALGGIELRDERGNPTNVWDNRLHRGESKHKIDLRGHYLHNSATEVRNQFPNRFAAYFKFSVVRNPWAQMVSFFRRQTEHRKHPPGNFEQFIDEFPARLIPGTVPRASLYDDDGRMLMDYVGRFETLAEDFSVIASRIELPSASLPMLNSSKGNGYRDLYTARTREAVREMFQADIETYGYSF